MSRYVVAFQQNAMKFFDGEAARCLPTNVTKRGYTMGFFLTRICPVLAIVLAVVGAGFWFVSDELNFREENIHIGFSLFLIAVALCGTKELGRNWKYLKKTSTTWPKARSILLGALLLYSALLTCMVVVAVVNTGINYELRKVHEVAAVVCLFLSLTVCYTSSFPITIPRLPQIDSKIGIFTAVPVGLLMILLAGGMNCHLVDFKVPWTKEFLFVVGGIIWGGGLFRAWYMRPEDSW